ncbi:MAG: hypothetical protein ABWZ42_05435 [Ilumatobacteraceae bacterium]
MLSLGLAIAASGPLALARAALAQEATTESDPVAVTTEPVSTVPAPVQPITTEPVTTAAPESAPETTAVTGTPAATGTPAPAQAHIPVQSGQVAQILATIRYLESRGDYLAPPNKGNASGAYQFIASTWNGYGGYSHAYLAPPWVQDERAAIDVNRFLAQWRNDVSMIPVMWYYPRAATDPALMDVVPVPSAGNVLTIREYQLRWLAVFAFVSGKPVAAPLTQADVLARAGLPPTVPPAEDGSVRISFPALGPARVAAPDCEQPGAVGVGLCSETAPGIVFGVKLQPVLAVHDGVVTAVDDAPGAPISITITDVSGRGYTYHGFNDDNPGTDDGAAPAHLRLSGLAKVGGSVKAGQIIGFMGDSDPLPPDVRADVPTDATIRLDPDAVAPHIRLTISELDGTPLDAYGPVIDALFRQACSVAIGPWIMPPPDAGVAGAGLAGATIETTDDDRAIDSQWNITASGQVTAAGWAAMIYPNEGCTFAPPDTHGPGAAGFGAVTLDWMAPVDLPTSIWVALAVRDELGSPPVPVRRG